MDIKEYTGNHIYTCSITIAEMEVLYTEHSLQLQGDTHKYLHNVIRTTTGTIVRCIAENGYIAVVTITSTTKKYTIVSLVSYQQKARPPHTIILAVAGSKQIRRSWLLEKSVELQIASLWVWNAERSQGSIAVKESWNSVLRNASTQCGNPYIPTLREFSNITNVITEIATISASALFFYENTEHSTPPTMQEFNAIQQPLVLIIGPEGGFTTKEVSALQHAHIPARSLGSSILRYETAGLVACSLAYMANDVKGMQK